MSLATLLLPILLLSPFPQRPGGQPGPQDGVPRPGAASAQATAPQAAGADQGQAGLPTLHEVGDMLYLTAAESGDNLLNLETLTKLCQTQTGRVFTYDDPTGTEMRSKQVRMLGTRAIPKSDFYSFYQILMFIHGYTLTKVGPDHLALYLVQSAQPAGGPRGQQLKSEALFIDVADIDKYSDQVATQIITVMHLPHVDVRSLGQTLRIFVDAQGQQALTPVGTSQSVILNGFASTVASMVKILKLVDSESARDVGVRPDFEVIPMQFTNADDLAEVLTELIEASTRAEQQGRAAQQAQGVTGPLTAACGEAKILTDPRTNSLLVMALPADMKNIKELVARLDVDVLEPERTYHVYALENAKAEDLAEVLEEFVTGASRVATAPGQGGARGGGQNAVPQGGSSRDNEVVVKHDETTNSLLIAASKRRYEELRDLILRLDRRQDQVLIETALIEVSGNNSLDLGVELGFADLPGSRTGSFGITNFGLGTFEDTDGDGIPDVKVPNQGLGVVGGILEGDDFSLPLLVAALQDKKNTNVLNIPSVLVSNNHSALVESKDSQPTTTVTALGGQAGQTQENFNNYQDAGITLSITPSISASGYLRLDVDLLVSVFQGQFTGAIPPPKVTRVIRTSVNVPDGDTMVIGGIIVDNKSDTASSIPWLGDLPILGHLFRRDTNNANRTTLYFFVTPHIMRDLNFADLAERSYKTKVSAAEVIGADRIQLIDPAFGSTEGQVDLSGFDVPLYRSPKKGEIPAEAIGETPGGQGALPAPVEVGNAATPPPAATTSPAAELPAELPKAKP